MKNVSESISSLKNKKVFVFDFDGVIVDSVGIKTKAFSQLFENYGSNVQKKVVDHHLVNGGMSRYKKISFYYKEFLNHSLNEQELNKLCDDFSDLVLKKVIEAPLIDGVLSFLNKLNKMNKKIYINTGTPQDEIKIILQKKQLIKIFDAAYGSPRSKDQNMEIIIRQNSKNLSDYIFFGDALSDLSTAIKFNIDFVGVGLFIKKYLNKVNHFHIENFNEIKI
tara:strand:+ start:186 stop:851 length:666 start_codon:yes stop_codon:yes gene_type:complete